MLYTDELIDVNTKIAMEGIESLKNTQRVKNIVLVVKGNQIFVE